MTASSRWFFSRITPEISIVLTALRIEFLTQPVRAREHAIAFRGSASLETRTSNSQAGSEFTPQPSQNDAKFRSDARENAATRGDPRGPRY